MNVSVEYIIRLRSYKLKVSIFCKHISVCLKEEKIDGKEEGIRDM